jgi:Zn-dependent M28 family amino/carboxypeptidase
MVIIFNAHYDSVKVSPGADDDGSGVAAVLAAAYVLSQYTFNHTIKFICFSGEEEGLLGSKFYSDEAYENNENIIIEFNADMIGYAKTIEDGEKFRIYATKDIDWYVDIIDNLNDEFEFNFEFTRGILSEDSRGGSDYSSFTRYGFEAIAFFEGSWNLNMHTKNDDLSNINISYLTRTTSLITASIAYISDMIIDYPFIRFESPKKGNLYFEGRELKELKDRRNDQLRTIVIDDICIWADILHDHNNIEKVEFYYNGKLQFTDSVAPFKWILNKFSLFNHRIEVISYSYSGETASDWIDILFINPRIRN